MADIQLIVPAKALEKAKRDGRTISKYVVSQETGIPYNTVDAYWENNVQRLDRSVLRRLANYFGCSVKDLMQDVPDPELVA